MNLYVQFTSDHPGFLNLKPDDESSTFNFFKLDSGKLVQHTHTFNDYIYNLYNSKEVIYYFFTTASTPDELYSMHPELLI